jgi:hypothetical protein
MVTGLARVGSGRWDERHGGVGGVGEGLMDLGSGPRWGEFG